MEEGKKPVTHILMTLSVTFMGENEPPLVATRILADSQEVEMPFVLVAGDPKAPLTLAKGVRSTIARVQYSNALHSLAAGLSESAVAELEELARGATALGPALEVPPAPNLDGDENQ